MAASLTLVTNLALVILLPIACNVVIVLISLNYAKYTEFRRSGEIDYLFFLCSFVTCTATVLDVYGIAFPQLTAGRRRGVLAGWQNPWHLGILLLVLGVGLICSMFYQQIFVASATGSLAQRLIRRSTNAGAGVNGSGADNAVLGTQFGKMVWNLTLLIVMPFLLLVPSRKFDHLASTGSATPRTLGMPRSPTRGGLGTPLGGASGGGDGGDSSGGGGGGDSGHSTTGTCSGDGDGCNSNSAAMTNMIGSTPMTPIGGAVAMPPSSPRRSGLAMPAMHELRPKRQKLMLWLWTTASVATIIVSYNFGHFFVSAFISVAPTPEHKFVFVLVFDWTFMIAKFGFAHITARADAEVLGTFSGSHGVTKLYRHRISNRCEIAYKLVRFGFYYSIFTEVTDVISFIAVELATLFTNLVYLLLMVSRQLYFAISKVPLLGRAIPTEDIVEWQQADGMWRRFDAASNQIVRTARRARQREVRFEGADGATYTLDMDRMVMTKETTVWTGRREMSTTSHSELRQSRVVSRQWLYQHQQRLFFGHWCQGVAQLIAALQFMVCIGIIVQQHESRTSVGPQYVIYSLLVGLTSNLLSSILLEHVMGASNTPSGVAQLVIEEDRTEEHDEDDGAAWRQRTSSRFFFHELLYSFMIFATHIITDIDYGVVSRLVTPRNAELRQ